MQLYTTGGMACGWFFLIFCSPRLAKSSLPFRGSAYVKGKQHDKQHAVEGTPISYFTKTMSPAIKTRTKQHFPDSETLLFLTIHCIQSAQLYLQNSAS